MMWQKLTKKLQDDHDWLEVAKTPPMQLVLAVYDEYGKMPPSHPNKNLAAKAILDFLDKNDIELSEMLNEYRRTRG